MTNAQSHFAIPFMGGGTYNHRPHQTSTGFQGDRTPGNISATVTPSVGGNVAASAPDLSASTAATGLWNSWTPEQQQSFQQGIGPALQNHFAGNPQG